MNNEDYKVIEKHRLEYENIIIMLINSGWTKSEAKIEALDRILEKENREDKDEQA